MNEYITLHSLNIGKSLFALVADEIAPDTGIEADFVWATLADIIKDLGPENASLLEQRNVFQKQIDTWHQQHNSDNFNACDYKKFLSHIGYIQKEGEDFSVTTHHVDPEISDIAGPQLVVPVDNPRYALNAANARWVSLYDALYSTDVIPELQGCKKTKKYNPVRGIQVIKYARKFLDRAVPLEFGSHAYVVKYQVKGGKLIAIMGDGSKAGLGKRERFIGHRGNALDPSSILLSHNGLHIEICIGEGYFIGRGDLANVYDIKLESAVTTIMDCEDSVSAVDVADKVSVYRNWLGLMRGTLKRTLVKEGQTLNRELEQDREFIAANGDKITLPGRSLMLIRNVGLHMYTDAVTQKNGQPIPEGFLDALITIITAKHDLLGNSPYRNSRTNSIYIVKPKLHGPAEVAFTVKLFTQLEKAFGMPKNTVKIGIMDEERRTTVNLKECIRVASERIIFINTGFLDRTGDEIHTSMEAGPMLKKNSMKDSTWLKAYEDWNVDIGLETGLPGHGQIGKGMWAAPDNMAEMMDVKISHPRSGATTAWVPSPIAATLHAMHYHRVNVKSRLQELRHCPRASLDDILTLPIISKRQPSSGEVRTELENNAQGILGYVVRWINQGLGCSKVADIHDVALMEDRATLRISSQHIANWLHHGYLTREQIIQVFEKMAAVVDFQNENDPTYEEITPNFDQSIAFQAALDLVFTGRDQANGYTEAVLHARRKEYKARVK